jgi:molecular chaperone DnaK (HSP70)
LTAAFLVGIDLGTTNTVVAFTRRDGSGEPSILAIPQLVTRSEVAARPLLPSALYAPVAAEGASDPWTLAPWVGGEYAKRRGAEVPGRQVASAKSWLAHDAVGRHAPILPWGIDPEDEAPRISPVDASARYLEHVRRAWDAVHPDEPLAEQEVVLTVPASFDETARELTLEAANSIGLMPRLLEEPAAAFYDWMRSVGEAGVAALVGGAEAEALVLVCDVGGGTTDLSLIRVARTNATKGPGVAVSRVAVGRHLLLGGDNMDLALAHACERKMSETRLDPARFAQLVVACREAKEKLLTGAVDEVGVAVAGAGARLVGGTLATKITRDEAEAIVVEGFFPRAARDAEPTRARAGLLAFGLPYERDVAITRHVASFLARHAGPASSDAAGSAPAPLMPSAILLNGGVFRAPRLVSRLVEAIEAWGDKSPKLRLLAHADPDLAVARGAVVYGLARHGKGLRIGGGSPRGYYVEVAGEGERAGVCVVPRGAREGVMQIARSRPLSLTIGRPARFELWASDEAIGHAPGDVVRIDEERFTRLPPVAAAFGRGPAAAKQKDETIVVALEGELTEVGTLDLACVELEPAGDALPRRFRLAFALRQTVPASTSPPPAVSVAPGPRAGGALDGALEAVARVYGKGRADVTPRDVKDLVRELERHLGERGSWNTATTRALFDVLAPGRSGRRRSADHERVFWQLAGFCLRPGFGDPMDGERIALLAPLAPERLSFPDQTRGWQQFFIAWRRVAAGMSDPQQIALRDLADPWLAPSEVRAKMKKQKGAKPLADPEMLDMVASLERVPASRRAELGAWVLERTWTDRDARLWGAIGRLGARAPAYASVDHVIAPAIVERWIEQMLREKWDQAPSVAEAAIALARVTGDRARDLSEAVRKEVARRLGAVGEDPARIRAVLELVAVEEEERAAFWGESLPVGLRLVGEPA